MKRSFALLCPALCLHVIFAFAGLPRPVTKKLTTADLVMFSASLFTTSGNVVDGNRVVFDQVYSNTVDGNDAIKLLNPGENFGILRDGLTLAVEARQPIAAGDTLYFQLSNLRIQQYRLELTPENIGTSGIQCELIDRFMNTTQQINLLDSNHLSLTVTSDPASRAADRLLIVFKNTASTEPFQFLNVSTIQTNGKTLVDWLVRGETDIDSYYIEHGVNGTDFTPLGSIPAFATSAVERQYQFEDANETQGDHFYRIRSLSRSGQIEFSNTVKISLQKNITSLLYPNPLVTRQFHVRMDNVRPGRHYVSLTSFVGQTFQTVVINSTTDKLDEIIHLASGIGKGTYTVTLRNSESIIATQTLVIP